ncbi:MAG TPA: C4-type zinc ribbon domain-containing protein [Friedmanniella sp.]
MTAQLRLLDLQAVDSALASLTQRRRALPEQVALDHLSATAADASSDLVGAQTRVSDLELDTERAEADLDPVRQRLTRNEKRIADGTVDAKALGSMVEEIAHLRRRISDLEDLELESMEALELAQAERDALQTRVDGLAAELDTATGARDAAVQKLTLEANYQRTERDRLAPEIPADLLTLYTRIQTSKGGVGAAALVHRSCTGCQLQVNANELREYATTAPDEVLRCEECGRILVRTAESGL